MSLTPPLRIEFSALLPLLLVTPKVLPPELITLLLLRSSPSKAATPAPAAVIRLWLPRYCWAFERRSPAMQGMPYGSDR
ncbi:hypothetical protein D9M69_554260 [compost metagenome]